MGASRSVWEEVECQHRHINVRRVSDPTRAFRPALGLTGITDDWYRSSMGVTVISSGIRPSAREIFECTWKRPWTKAGITSTLWEMTGFWWIFIQRTAHVIWESPEVHEQSISLNAEYDAWIIVHYHFWIILAIIFFNIVFFVSLHWGTKEKGEWFNRKCRYTKLITQPTRQMIAIKHGVNVIHCISNLVRAYESRNTQFIISPKKLEALGVFADYLYLACGRNWYPILFDSICDIYPRCNEMLASCEFKWAFERQWSFGWKRGVTTWKRGGPDGECCVEKRSTQKVLEECRQKKSAKSRLRSADRDWGAPIQAEERQQGGGCGKQCGVQYRSDNPDRSALVGNEELSSLVVERGMEGIKCLMRQKSINQVWGAPTEIEESQSWVRSDYPSGLAPHGGIQQPTDVGLMSAVPSVVKRITGDGQNVPRYSSWQNISLAFSPLGYPESAQWIAAAASAKADGVGGWKCWDVVGWHPKPLEVKKNWW